MTLTELKARMEKDSALILLGDISDSEDDIISDAVSQFVKKMDYPIISASLSVTEGNKGPYDLPETISKIRAIYDNEGDGEVYTCDEVRGQITLQDAPAGNLTYTVYGTTDNIITNLSTVVAAIPENDLNVLFAYVRAYAYDWGNEATADAKLQKADFLAAQARKAKNRSINNLTQPIGIIDAQGNRIVAANNPFGLSGISGLYEQDL